MPNHYQTLGLTEGASLEAVNTAYRRALHRFRQHQLAGKPLPEADFDALQQAYRCLKDTDSKAAYDRDLPGGTPIPETVAPDATVRLAPRPAPAPVTPAAAPAAGLQLMEPPAPAVEPSIPATPAAATPPPVPPVAPPARPVETPPPARSAGPVEHRFRFTGQGGEYFRIWIVNLLLSILTLGIYSAWAKVRREQYFHRNTLLDDSGFDYHGDPKAILKGRGIAWGLLLLLSLVEKGAPIFYPLALLVLLPVVPWLMVRSFAFRARNTSYRGLRFEFDGTYRQAALVFLGYGLLTLVTLGIAFPVLLRQIKLFQLNNLSFGGERFETNPDLGSFFGVFIRGGLLSVAPMAVAGIIAAVLMSSAGRNGGMGAALAMLGTVTVVFALAYIVTLCLVQPYIQSRLANLVWNHTRVGPHLFGSDQTLKSLAPIFVLNWLFTLLTLGLYWPWAKVKLAAYRADHTLLSVEGDLDAFIGEAVSYQSAVGEEVADAFDFDIAL